MTLFVLLRLYCRVWVTKSVAGDDIACIIASVIPLHHIVDLLTITKGLAVGLLDMLWCFDIKQYVPDPLHFTGSHRTVKALNEGIGLHFWDTRTPSMTDGLRKKLFANNLGYIFAIFFAKLSLFLLYLRIFRPNLRTRYLIYFGIVGTGLAYTIYSLIVAISCKPSHSKNWQAAGVSLACDNIRTFGSAISLFNIVNDFYILLLPIPVIWRLQLPLCKKIGVIGVLMTGLFISKINVGIIVGCMPLLTSYIRTHVFNWLRWQSVFAAWPTYLRINRHQSRPPIDPARLAIVETPRLQKEPYVKL